MDIVPTIAVAQPEVRSIMLHKSYPGYLTSEQTVNLVARVNGYLQNISYTPGSIVKEGQLLFVIEPTLYQDAVSQAEAGLKTAQAQLNYSQNNYSRMKEAAASNAVSEIDLIQSETNVNEALASVKNAKAQLATARTNLGYCYIRAPFTGRISRNIYDVGNYINGSVQATVLASLYKDNKMYVYFNIEDNQYLKLIGNSSAIDKWKQLPGEVAVNFRESLARKYVGRLDYLSPNIDLSTGTMSLRAEIDNPDGELKSGLYVTIDLPYGENPSAVLIDDASIGNDQLGKYVYLVNDSNIVNYQHIEVGELVDDTLREVTKGISSKDRYVTKALLKVRNGMKIEPKTGVNTKMKK